MLGCDGSVDVGDVLLRFGCVGVGEGGGTFGAFAGLESHLICVDRVSICLSLCCSSTLKLESSLPM